MAQARQKDSPDVSTNIQDAGRSRKAPTAFRTISEVADELNVQQHVLRFWETKFSHVKPLKRGGGRRYYRPEDVALLRRIHHLLYTEGYTIKGVQKLIKGQGRQQVIAASELPRAANEQQSPVAPTAVLAPAVAAITEQTGASRKLSEDQRKVLEATLVELKALRASIEDIL